MALFGSGTKDFSARDIPVSYAKPCIIDDHNKIAFAVGMEKVERLDGAAAVADSWNEYRAY